MAANSAPTLDDDCLISLLKPRATPSNPRKLVRALRSRALSKR